MLKKEEILKKVGKVFNTRPKKIAGIIECPELSMQQTQQLLTA